MNRIRKALNLALATGFALGVSVAATAQTPSGSAQPQTPSQGGQMQTPPQGQAPAPSQGTGLAAPQPGTAAPAAGGTGEAGFGYTMTPPEGWTRATDTSTITVPGEVCCAWSPDGTATLVVFRQKPPKPFSPRALLTQSVAAFQKSLGATAEQQDVRDIGGMRAMWMIVSGKGNGAAIDGKGTVPTTQHWVAIPRSDDVLIFLLTAPQDKFATYDAALQQSLQGIQLSGTQTAIQKAAK
jgi:hypothetical protein